MNGDPSASLARLLDLAARYTGDAERDDAAPRAGAPARRTLVVAASHQHFLDYCHDEQLNPRDRDLIYATERSVRGHHDVDIVYVEGWWRRRDSQELRMVLMCVSDANISHWSWPRPRR